MMGQPQGTTRCHIGCIVCVEAGVTFPARFKPPG